VALLERPSFLISIPGFYRRTLSTLINPGKLIPPRIRNEHKIVVRLTFQDNLNMNQFFENFNWRPPKHWARIATIDMHTGGEPLRVLVDGLPTIEGRTVLEKRRYFREHYDYIRTGLMWEPRGHADMYGAVITPSVDADFDVFFLHNDGYSTMCGHAIIALTKLVIETGLVGKQEITINVPAGKVHARATIENERVIEAAFRNVPSFLYLRDQQVQVPEVGNVRFDVAYGGAFYAFVEAEQLGLDLAPEHCNRIIDYGRRIKQAVMTQFQITHPFEADLSFLYGAIFTGPAVESSHHSRNVCIFADGELDRSATGSGVSARAALHHAKGELRLNERVTIESILGSTMSVEVVEVTKFGPYDAVVPEVSGTASIIGRNEFYFDPEDPFREGFIFR
jgi:proline racemase